MSEEDSRLYELNWGEHSKHVRNAIHSLLTENEFTDVTLSCEGKKLYAHKVLLSACSKYFRDLFKDNPCSHPIVILYDVKYEILATILDFIYKGEASVSISSLDTFLRTAESLQISGIAQNVASKNKNVTHNISKTDVATTSKNSVTKKRSTIETEEISDRLNDSSKKLKLISSSPENSFHGFTPTLDLSIKEDSIDDDIVENIVNDIDDLDDDIQDTPDFVDQNLVEEIAATSFMPLHQLMHMGKVRRRCVKCYGRNVMENGRVFAQNKTVRVPWKCSICESFFCETCFHDYHQNLNAATADDSQGTSDCY